MAEPLHIVSLTVENVKRIRAVKITPAGDVVTLKGRNAQGKTSVLDAIWMAVGGGTATKKTEVTSPIREGEDSALVEVDLGRLKVIREWTRDGDGEVTTKLHVLQADGLPLASPQTVLDRLIGHAGFDPIAFTNLPDKEQVAALAKVVDLPFDPIEHDQVTQGVFQQRTEVGRKRDAALGAAKGLPRYPNAPAEETRIPELLDELAAAEQFYRDGELLRNTRAAMLAEEEKLRARVVELETQLREANEALNQVLADIDDQEHEVKHWEETPEKPDIDEIKDRIRDVGAENEKVVANRRYAEASAIADVLVDEYKGLSDLIEQRRAEKRDALAAATFPVDGLGFEDGQVVYQGQPFRQASGAEQVEISTAIAMAGNPDLRVITIRDASLLDAEHLAIVERMAAERGYQIWLERVEDDAADGIVIEDGSVKS